MSCMRHGGRGEVGGGLGGFRAGAFQSAEGKGEALDKGCIMKIYNIRVL